MSLLLLLRLLLPPAVSAEYLGELSENTYAPDSTANPFGAGSPFKPDGINNPFSPYGSPFSNQSATNLYATDAPRLYDQQGNYRGKLSTNPYDPDSTSNPIGRDGSPFSPDSTINRYGLGLCTNGQYFRYREKVAPPYKIFFQIFLTKSSITSPSC